MRLAMKGDGFYDSHALVQESIIHRTEALIDRCLQSRATPEGVYGIVDYGCSEGGNSLPIIRSIVEKVSERWSPREFSIVFNDLPQNNFNALFNHLEQAPDWGTQARVYCSASGKSFYQQVVPRGTVHFGFSSSSIHWLSSIAPYAVREHIFMAGGTEQEKLAIAARAREDWNAFLAARSEELAPGGCLLLTLGAALRSRDESYSCEILLDLLNSVLRNHVHSGDIDEEKYARFCLPMYMRHEHELREPFDSELHILSLEHLSIRQLESPFVTKYEHDHDAEAYAQAMVGSLRAFTEPQILSQLLNVEERRRGERQGQAAQALVDAIYNEVAKRIEDKPQVYTFNPITAFLIVRRL